MSKLENPKQFNTNKDFNTVKVRYLDLLEISQGGPLIGTISINGNKVENYRFGGPCLYEIGCLFAPIYVKKFLGTGFKIAKINVDTLVVEVFGKTQDIIFLDRIENNRVYFFEDLDETISNYYELNV